jgi:hypothetical protein
LHRIAASGLGHEQLLALDDKALDEKLFPPRESRNTARPLPDWEMIEQQLRGRGVTLRLLWQEYQEGKTDGYQYTQFLRHLDGRLSVHPVPAALPGLATGFAPVGDAPGPTGRCGARGRLRRDDLDGD